MTGVFGGEFFASKNMTQVGIAIGTADFGSSTVGKPFDRSLNFLIKAGPAAAGMELGRGLIERGVTVPAIIGALDEKIIIFTTEGWFCLPANNHLLFFRGEVTKGGFHFMFLVYWTILP